MTKVTSFNEYSKEKDKTGFKKTHICALGFSRVEVVYKLVYQKDTRNCDIELFKQWWAAARERPFISR